LRALLAGLFAFVLVIQAAAAATMAESTVAGRPARAAQATRPVPPLERRLERARKVARKHRATIRFYAAHPKLLTAPEHRKQGVRSLRDAKRRLARAQKAIAWLQREIERRDARRLASMPPRRAICHVFGDYCGQAVDVAWCESRLQTTARNGQYLGLFQMGSYERRLFGHGSTAHEQAVAAHKYFVRSGRDWSPWSCRWAAS
jgi:hypothetical protein